MVKGFFVVQDIKNLKFDALGIQQALKQAHKAYVKNEVPVGAVVLDKYGHVVARAYNQIENKESQLAHAELQVIYKLTKKMKRWRLSNCTLYVTLQPCMMCMGAIILSRIQRVVYTAKSPLFGCDLDKYEWHGIYKDSLPSIEFKECQEAVNLLKNFFRKQRSAKSDN